MASLVVAALACWRLSVAVWMGDAFAGLRTRVGAHEYPAVTFWGKQLSCFWCVSLWVSVPDVLVWWAWWPALLPLAFSGAAMLLSGAGRILYREMVEHG